MARRDIVVIGASAGGVEALERLVADLPWNFPASVFVVLHVYPHGPSYLPQILSRAGPLPAVHAANRMESQLSTIYIAPPDFHLRVLPNHMHLSHGPHENRHRPAIDVLFRTAAHAYGPRVIGVVLSGLLDDGTAGLLEIKRRGGLAVVQDPATARYPDMPRSALENVEVDYVAPVDALASLLVDLVKETVPDAAPIEDAEVEMDAAEAGVNGPPGATNGTPSVYACPECSGVLWEIQDGPLVHYVCRVGHSYSVKALLDAQQDAAEDALWIALRTIEENGSFARRMAQRARDRNRDASAEDLLARAAQAEGYAQSLRAMLEDLRGSASRDALEGEAPARGEGRENA